MKICPNCKKEVTDESLFCNFCATPVKTEETKAENTKKISYEGEKINWEGPVEDKKKSKKGIVIAVISVLLVAVIVCGIIFIPKLMNKSAEPVTESQSSQPSANVNGDKGKPKNEYNLVKETHYNAYNELAYRHEYSYDALGNQVKDVAYDSEGNITGIEELEYDDKGNAVKITTTDYQEDGSAFSYRIVAEYDSHGNMVKVVYYEKDEGITGWTEKTYDEQGHEVKSVEYDRDGNIANSYEYEYDAQGNMIKSIQENMQDPERWNQVYEYKYDSKGNMIEMIGHGAFDISVKNEYDADGRLIREVHTGGAEYGYRMEYEYDAQGNLVKRTQTTDDPRMFEGEVSISWWEYEYDAQGNLIKEKLTSYSNYPDEHETSSWTEYEYDAHGNNIKESDYDDEIGLRGYIIYEYAPAK